MADREKVIASLGNALVQMHGCGRYTPEDVDELETAAWGALELLEEQEPVPPQKVKRYIEYSDTAVTFPDKYDCGKCGEELPNNAKYCPACGQAVKRE